MKKMFLLFGVFLILVIGMVIAKNYLEGNVFWKTAKATINNNSFKLYVAKSPKDKQIGLSEKKSLPEDYGMIFLFEKPDYYGFWMRNMDFPIDIIYIRNNSIVTIYSDIRPPSSPNGIPPIFKPKVPADTVLEINAGLSQKYNLKEGDKVIVENL